MFVTGIDITSTLDILLNINQVELDDTGNGTIFLVRWCTVLSSQLQIDTRSQGHLIEGCTVVAITFLQMTRFPVIIGIVIVYIGLSFVHVSARIVKVYVTGQCSQIVHTAIDTEVVAMKGLLPVCIVFGVIVIGVSLRRYSSF